MTTWNHIYYIGDPADTPAVRLFEAEEKVQDAYERGFKEGQMNILETQE